MKKLMLMAYGAFFVLAQSTVSAQENKPNVKHVPALGENLSSYHDTIVINLQGNNKIIFIGNALKKMGKYQKADSLKMLFLNDFEKAVSENSITKEVQTVHYFVHGSGKRRLKAETPDYSDDKVDVDYEIIRLNLDLPKYRYFIHDLSSGYELQVYINDPGQVKNILDSVNLNGAIHYSGICKKGYTGAALRSYKLEINADHNNYKLVNVTKGLNDQIQISGVLGIGILGNVLSPMLGANLDFAFADRYAIGKFKAGISISAFNIVSMNAGKITGVSLVRSYDLNLMYNLSSGTHKNYYVGLQGGFMKSNELSPFNNALKSGIVVQTPRVGICSLDQIYCDGSKKWIYGLTWRLPF